LEKLSAPAKEAYTKWFGMRKDVREVGGKCIFPSKGLGEIFAYSNHINYPETRQKGREWQKLI
jgi:hypothetical protein